MLRWAGCRRQPHVVCRQCFVALPQVFTTHSGYGRLGAFMSGRYHQAYGIDFWKDSVEVPPKQRCGPKDYIKSWNV